jgi:hypothetical protein
MKTKKAEMVNEEKSFAGKIPVLWPTQPVKSMLFL